MTNSQHMTYGMPVLTEEQRQALIEHCKFMLSEHVKYGGYSDDEEVYRIALASLQAEPVVYLTTQGGCRAPDDCEYWPEISNADDVSCDGSPAFPVFTAPPVPVMKLPAEVINALTLALQAMEFMGDTLNNLDAVCTDDVEHVTPAFEAVRALLAAGYEVE